MRYLLLLLVNSSTPIKSLVHFILGEFDAAMSDYKKSTDLDDSFIFSQVQYAVALYKTEKTGEATIAFQSILSKFSESSEAYNYYGELLLDQQKFGEAVEHFDRAIEIESSKEKSSNVLPMINKALGLFQWKQDMSAAEDLCREALAIDPDCDVAVATLAQLSLQQAKVPEAIAYFERSAQIARTEPELINAITYENVSFQIEKKFVTVISFLKFHSNLRSFLFLFIVLHSGFSCST